MKKFAFTLSEVLLTLSIIGVVSAMTVPSLMTSIEDRELQAQAKKAYNTLQSAISMQYALTRMTPEDVQEELLLEFLMSGPSTSHGLGGAKVMKFVETDADNYPWFASLPDGQIIVVRLGSNYCKESTPCQVMFDINGSDGPNFGKVKSGGATQTTAGSALTQTRYENFSSYASSSTFDRQYRDIVFFEVAGLTVRPKPNQGSTKRYFTGQQ
jgi:prepilin-type N-terminal cleavage/methylation domain-containing protein